MKTLKVILSSIGILIFFALIFCIGYWVYYKFFAPERFTELTINLSTVEDTNGKKPILEVVYYENADNSGVELLDVKLNGYSDINATNIVSFGVQVIGGLNNLESATNYPVVTATTHPLGIMTVANDIKHIYTFIDGDIGKRNHDAGKIAFYEESDNLNYANVNTDFNDFGYIRVEIEEKVYALKFGYNRDFWKVLWETHHNSSSLSEFVKDVGEQVKRCPIGEINKTFGYKDMFEIFEIIDGKFENVSNQDETYSYMFINFKHYQTGAKTAKDSLFKQIQYNPNFVVDGHSQLDEHFSDKSIFNINEQWLEFKFNEEKQAHYFDLQEKCFNYLKDKNLNVELIIDLDYLKEIGIAFGGLAENSKLQELGIKSYYTLTNGVKSEVQL